MSSLPDPPGVAGGSASELARRLREREVSAVELVDAVLSAIGETNGTLNAFLTVDADAARRAAKRADGRLAEESAETPPLLGVPVAIKDLQTTAGLRTTFGSILYRDHVPEQDTIAVARLRAAGAVIVGKTNCPEFGLLGETRNLLGEDGRNPWDPTRTCGGSSGGSAAAVAAGIVSVALGDDGAGSVTAPASMCGALGMKATRGRIPLGPEDPQSFLYTDPGPLARTVEDLALMVDVMSGSDPADPLSLRGPLASLHGRPARGAEDLRVAFTPDLGHFAVDPVIVSALEDAAAALVERGCTVDVATPEIRNPWPVYEPLFWADTWALLGELVEANPDGLLSESRDEVLPGRDVTQVDVIRSLDGLWRIRWAVEDFFDRFDVLLMPTTATPSFPIGEAPTELGGKPVRPYWSDFMPFPVLANMCGLPAVNVPWGLAPDGVPIGLLVTARTGRDDVALDAAHLLTTIKPVSQAPEVRGGGGDGALWL